MNETSGRDVPWGRPPVDGIPLPPFADVAAHRSYVRSLQTFLLLLDGAEPAAATIALAAALEAEVPSREADVSSVLSPLALDVSLSTFFPAPWTPEALAAALDGSRYGTPTGGRGRWAWGGDPDYAATETRTGWEIRRYERGSVETATLAHRDDLVLMWMDMFRNRFPYPIAHMPAAEAATPEALAEAARASVAAHAVNVAMPYLENWRDERDRAMTGGRGEAGSLR
jgi:hypothetical protein